jgi:hypothetical protein
MEDPKPAVHLTKTLERVRTNASKVRVTCGTSGKSVTVRINDRRPLHGNRVLDRFREAASKFGIIGAVVGKVKSRSSLDAGIRRAAADASKADTTVSFRSPVGARNAPENCLDWISHRLFTCDTDGGERASPDLLPFGQDQVDSLGNADLSVVEPTVQRRLFRRTGRHQPDVPHVRLLIAPQRVELSRPGGGQFNKVFKSTPCSSEVFHDETFEEIPADDIFGRKAERPDLLQGKRISRSHESLHDLVVAQTISKELRRS